MKETISRADSSDSDMKEEATSLSYIEIYTELNIRHEIFNQFSNFFYQYLLNS
jgi:hypothetical protein